MEIGNKPVKTSAPERSPSARSVPPCPWHAHWLTVREFAHLMGRSPYTVRWWIKQDILAEFGIPVYRTRMGRLHSGRIFIRNVI